MLSLPPPGLCEPESLVAQADLTCTHYTASDGLEFWIVMPASRVLIYAYVTMVSPDFKNKTYNKALFFFYFISLKSNT